MKKMINLQKIAFICICLMLTQSLFVVSYVLARGANHPITQPPPRTPTSPDGGGGGEDSDDGDKSDTVPAPAGARISGFVYNYSSAAYEGGVTVVVDGGGWQIETVTDSNGFYQIGDLGAGRAVISLRLPPAGPQPATINWPVRLVSEADEHVNLGYYWGDDPPIPVILLGDLMDNRLAVQIENRTPVTATGGLVEILPPTYVKVSPPVEIDKGNVASFNPRRFQFNVTDIPPGGSVSINALLQQAETAMQVAQTAPKVRVTFTYDQQITPQVIEIDLSDSLIPAALILADSPQDAEDAALDQAASPEDISSETVHQATPAGQGASQASISSTPVPPSPDPSESQVAVPEQDTPEAAPTVLSPAQDASPGEATPQPPGIAPLPETGSNQTTSDFVKLSLSALLTLGLGIGGWRAMRTKR